MCIYILPIAYCLLPTDLLLVAWGCYWPCEISPELPRGPDSIDNWCLDEDFFTLGCCRFPHASSCPHVYCLLPTAHCFLLGIFDPVGEHMPPDKNHDDGHLSCAFWVRQSWFLGGLLLPWKWAEHERVCTQARVVRLAHVVRLARYSMAINKS